MPATTRAKKRLSESEDFNEGKIKTPKPISPNEVFLEGEPDHCNNIWLMWETVKAVNQKPETENYLIPIRMINVKQYLGQSQCEVLYGESAIKTDEPLTSLSRTKTQLKKGGRRFLYKVDSHQEAGGEPEIKLKKLHEIPEKDELYKTKQLKKCNCNLKDPHEQEFCCFSQCQHGNLHLSCDTCKELDNDTE